MTLEPMTERQMVEYLKGMDALRKKISKKKKQLYGQVETLEDCIVRNTFQHSDGEQPYAAPYAGDKLFFIWKNVRRDIEREMDDVISQFYQLAKEEEQMACVQKCLNMLPLAQRELLEDLYLKNVTWTQCARDRCVSTATLGRQRKLALDILLYYYNQKIGRKTEG